MTGSNENYLEIQVKIGISKNVEKHGELIFAPKSEWTNKLSE